jgi:putative transposase
MSHSYYKLWVHAIFSTKDRLPLILLEFEPQILLYLKHYLNEFGCYVESINCMSDHVHVLFTQNPNKSIAETIKNLKGNSSHWINQENLFNKKFAWQTGYSAFSVSESQIKRVSEYINNQKNHHKKITFQQEYEEFLRLNRIDLGSTNG